MTTRSSLTSSWPLVSSSVDQLCSVCLHHAQTQALKRLLRAFPWHSGSAVWSWVCRSSAFSTADAQSFTTMHKGQASRWADCVSLPTPDKQEIQISGGGVFRCTNTDKMSHLWNAKYLFSNSLHTHTHLHLETTRPPPLSTTNMQFLKGEWLSVLCDNVVLPCGLISGDGFVCACECMHVLCGFLWLKAGAKRGTGDIMHRGQIRWNFRKPLRATYKHSTNLHTKKFTFRYAPV